MTALGGADPDGHVLSTRLRVAIGAHRPVALVTIVEGAGVGAKLLVQPGHPSAGTLGDPELDRIVARDALGELQSGWSGVRHYGARGEAGDRAVSVFVESFAPAPRMLIFGAVDFTAALARGAKLLGYRVTVCDAREVFATVQRFPDADEVVVEWPHRLLDEIGDTLDERDAICVLTHDLKFDIPALVAATATRVGYIGAMGSRRTHATRVDHLRAAGLGEGDIGRIMAPIGLDLGARTPEEVAVAVLAEIIACRTGRDAPSLRDTGGPIH